MVLFLVKGSIGQVLNPRGPFKVLYRTFSSKSDGLFFNSDFVNKRKNKQHPPLSVIG